MNKHKTGAMDIDDLREKIRETSFSTTGLFSFVMSDEDAAQLIEQKCSEQLVDLIGWIERNHLGKGFDGSDRWEHCAAEIVHHINELTNKKKGDE